MRTIETQPRKLTVQFFSILLSVHLISGNVFAEQQSAKVDTLAGELGAQIDIRPSWSVLEGFIDAQLSTDLNRGVYGAASRRLKEGQPFSDFDNPKKVSQYIYSLRKSMHAHATAALVRTGLPENIATEISQRMPRQYLFQLEEALLSYTAIPGMKPQDLGNAVKLAVRQSTTPLLVRRDMKSADFKSIADLIKAKTSADTKRELKSSRYQTIAYNQNRDTVEEKLERDFLQSVRDPKLIENKDLTEEMLKYLSLEAKNQFAALNEVKKKEAFLDSLAEDFVARASAAPIQVGAKQFSVSDAVKVLTSVGQFQALERNTASQISKGSEILSSALEKAGQALESNWKDQVEAARQISGGLDSLPASAAQLANTSHLVNDLASFASGGHLNRNTAMELAGMVSSQIPGSKDILNLTVGLEQIASGQSSFVQQGQVLLGALANITKSPVLGQVQSAFSSFAPVLQAAGPLLAMAGFASPLGGISMVGGLLGGGGGLMGGGGSDAQTQAMLQAISQKLEIMDHKLDKIMEDLDALDRKITEEHVQVMNALESISFDINRTLELVSSDAVKKFTRDCEAIPDMVESQELTSSQIEERFRNCYANLGLVALNPSSPEHFFRAIPNLKTDNLADTAFNKLQAIAKIYAKTSDSAQGSCFSLVLAAYSVHDIDRIGDVGKDHAKRPAEKALCTQVLSFGNMLHSGTIVFFSSLEDQAADYSKRMSQRSSEALIWNDNSRRLLLYRWNQELLLLNIAIGQQARLTGGFTVPEWAEKLELLKPLDQVEKTVFDQSEILAQNSLHYWLERHVSATGKTSQKLNNDFRQPVGSSLQYAFAYDACAPNYLRSLTEIGPHGPTDFAKIHFNWTPDVVDGSKNVKSLRVDDSATPASPCPNKSEDSKRWCALFEGLNNCIALPTPEGMITGELRRSDNLEALLDARIKILTLIETTNFIASLDHDNRLRLVEALAMKWGHDEKQKEIERATRATQQAAASLVQVH